MPASTSAAYPGAACVVRVRLEDGSHVGLVCRAAEPGLGHYPGIAGVAHALPALDDPQNFITAVQLMIEAIRTRAAVANH
jgi:hypothetical protein